MAGDEGASAASPQCVEHGRESHKCTASIPTPSKPEASPTGTLRAGCSWCSLLSVVWLRATTLLCSSNTRSTSDILPTRRRCSPCRRARSLLRSWDGEGHSSAMSSPRGLLAVGSSWRSAPADPNTPSRSAASLSRASTGVARSTFAFQVPRSAASACSCSCASPRASAKRRRMPLCRNALVTRAIPAPFARLAHGQRDAPRLAGSSDPT